MTLLLAGLLVGRQVRGVDFTTPRSPGLGGCVIMTEQSACDMLLVPSVRQARNEFDADLYGYEKFQLSELRQEGAAVAFTRSNYSLALGAVQFGKSDLYRELTERIVVSRRLGRLAVGAHFTTTSIDFGEYYSSLHTHSVGLTACLRLKSSFLGLNLDQLNSPSSVEGGVALEPILSGYLEFQPRTTYSILARMTYQRGEKTQYGFGQFIKLPYRARLFWGLSTQPTIYGAGLEFFAYKLFITCTTSYHTNLGLSRMITISFRTGRQRSAN